MKGLLLKDLINLKQQAKLYFIIIFVWFIIAISGKNASYIQFVMALFSLFIMLASFSYDEKANWNRYALTMPFSKIDLVFSKYLLVFVIAAISLILTTAFSFFITRDFPSSFISSATFALGGLAFCSVILPFIFHFGVEKGRIVMLVVFMVPSLLLLLLSRLNIPKPDVDLEALIQKPLSLAPLACVAVVLISMLISVRIMRRKEF